MARAPFKLRSGNASTFKNLGSSPAKQDDTSRFASIKPDKKKHEFPPETNSTPTTRDKTIQETKPNYSGNERDPVTNEGTRGNTGTNKTTETVSKPKSKKGGVSDYLRVTNKPVKNNHGNENKGTVKGITQFEYDMIPVTNVLNKVAKPYKKAGKKILEAHKKINPIAAYKKVKKYFTEK